nr:unnamed protein product [Callosobruchus analis]
MTSIEWVLSRTMSWRKTLYNPEDSKDLEELFEYFHSLDSDDKIYRQIQDAESLEVALIPPDDGEDSEQDDAGGDDDIVPNIRALGKVQSSKQIHASDKSWNISDDETLAQKQKILKLQNRTSRKVGKKIQREWKESILESRDQKVELLDETRSAILPLVTNALSRNKFESIRRFFHLNDNSVIDKSDKIYKIRPLIDHLNKVSQECIFR